MYRTGNYILYIVISCNRKKSLSLFQETKFIPVSGPLALLCPLLCSHSLLIYIQHITPSPPLKGIPSNAPLLPTATFDYTFSLLSSENFSGSETIYLLVYCLLCSLEGRPRRTRIMLYSLNACIGRTDAEAPILRSPDAKS